jgi:diguanylate cyclase (GGDEF)-like protein/PAS domain S-box-containing protein
MNNNELFHKHRLYQFIILLAGIIIVGSTLHFLHDSQTRTGSAERELLGVNYVNKLQSAMFEVQRVRGLYEVLRHGDLGAKEIYQDAQEQMHEKFRTVLADSYGTEIGLSHDLRLMQNGIQELLDELTHKNDPDSFRRFTYYIEQFRDMLLQTASRSHLALDADAATHYLADLSTNHLPSVIEALGRLRGIGAGIIANGKYQLPDLFLLEREIQAVDLELDHVERNLRTVFALNPEVKALLSERFTNIDKKIGRFTNTASSIIKNRGSDLDALSFFSEGTHAVGICDSICGSARSLLQEMLSDRISRLRQRATAVTTGLSSTIVLIVILAMVFHRRESQLVKKLMDETRFSSTLVDGLPGLFFLIDTEGRFRRWNREFERISGYDSEEITRLQATDLAAESYGKILREKMASVFREGSADAEFDVLTKDSRSIPVYASGLRVELENQPYIAGFALDITERKHMERRLEKMARTDALTGVFNRAKFNSDLKQMEENALRYNRGFALIAIDIDHFKRINDTYGHGAGDDVICEVVKIIGLQIRQLDSIYRYGGEEFHVILPETNLEGAILQAERLRKAVAEHNFNYVGRMTISLGIAEYQTKEAQHVLLKRADDSLYAAKVGGRNQVDKNPA